MSTYSIKVKLFKSWLKSRKNKDTNDLKWHCKVMREEIQISNIMLNLPMNMTIRSLRRATKFHDNFVYYHKEQCVEAAKSGVSFFHH